MAFPRISGCRTTLEHKVRERDRRKRSAHSGERAASSPLKHYRNSGLKLPRSPLNSAGRRAAKCCLQRALEPTTYTVVLMNIFEMTFSMPTTGSQTALENH